MLRDGTESARRRARGGGLDRSRPTCSRCATSSTPRSPRSAHAIERSRDPRPELRLPVRRDAADGGRADARARGGEAAHGAGASRADRGARADGRGPSRRRRSRTSTPGCALWPDNAVARYYAARAAERLGDFDRAIDDYRYAIRAGIDDTDARYRLARLYEAARAYALALGVARHAPARSRRSGRGARGAAHPGSPRPHSRTRAT